MGKNDVLTDDKIKALMKAAEKLDPDKVSKMIRKFGREGGEFAMWLWALASISKHYRMIGLLCDNVESLNERIESLERRIERIEYKKGGKE